METSQIAENVGLGTAKPYAKKFSVVQLDDLGYEGWAMRVWYNAPRRYFAQMLQVTTPEDTERAIERILEVVPEWNFIDGETGEGIPHTADGLNSDALPMEVFQAVILRAREESQRWHGLDPQSAGKSSPTSPGASSPEASPETAPTASPSPEPSAVTA